MWWFLLPVASAQLAATPLPPLVGHPATKLINEVVWDPTGTTLITTGDDGVRVWRGDALVRFLPGRFNHTLPGDRGATVIVGTKDRAIEFDVATGRELASWKTGWDWVEGLAADRQGRWVVIGDDSKDSARAYDRRSGALVALPDAVRAASDGSLAFSPAGVLYFAGSEGIGAWDPATGEAWSQAHRGIVARVDWSVGGAWLSYALWDWPGTAARPWDVGEVHVIGPDGVRRVLPHTGYDVAIGPQGDVVAIAWDREVRLYHTATGALLGTVTAASTVTAVDLGADHELAVATTAGPIERWRLAR